MLVFAALIGLFPRKIRKEKSPEGDYELYSEKCEKNTELNKKHSEVGEDEGASLKGKNVCRKGFVSIVINLFQISQRLCGG